MQPEIERRTYGAQLRAAGQSRTIQGYAAVFNSRSEDLGAFVEVISPGAFDRALQERHDVRALWNHNSDLILGRTKNGTLRLAVDERGLRIENDLPDTTVGRDALEAIRRGDVDQMSFAFRTLADRWSSEDSGAVLREVLDLELLDVSPVTYPAYTETQVSARAHQMARQRCRVAGGPLTLNDLRLQFERARR